MNHDDLMKRVKNRTAYVRKKTIVRYTRSPRTRSAFDHVYLALAAAEKMAPKRQGGPSNEMIEFCEAVVELHSINPH